MQDFDAPVRCAATADVLQTALHVQVSRVRRISQCVLLHSVLQLSEGRIATRTASVHERAAQISMAHRAGHACTSSCTSGLAAFVDERRRLRPLTRLQLGVRRSNCCALLHANAMEYARK
jgi:hypothetical protein